MNASEERDNISFISNSSTEDMCMICFTNHYSIHELACCSKIICTNCVTNWVKKQPIHDSLCVFCKKPNYIFQHSYIYLEEDAPPVMNNPIYTSVVLFAVFLLGAAAIYFFSFHT